MEDRKDKQIVQRVFETSLSGLREDPYLAQRILIMAQGKEEKAIPTVSKSLASTVVVIALFCVMGTGALAAMLNFWGIIDFAGKHINTYVPPRYEDSIVRKAITINTNHVTCTIQESYYDGKILRITALIEPKEPVLLVSGDTSPYDPADDLFPNPENRSMSLAQYALAYYDGQMADISLHTGRNDTHSFHPNDDGSTTLYMECLFDDELVQRELELRLVYMPVLISADASCKYDSSTREITSVPMVFHAVNVKTYTCNKELNFPSVGVSIKNVTITVTPLEIRYTLEYEITDLKAYNAQNNGLWFEFIDPTGSEDVISAQRVSDGLSSTGSIGRRDGLHFAPDEVGTVYQQSGSIGLDSFGDQYTIRAYNAMDKTRYETMTFTVSER